VTGFLLLPQCGLPLSFLLLRELLLVLTIELLLALALLLSGCLPLSFLLLGDLLLVLAIELLLALALLLRSRLPLSLLLGDLLLVLAIELLFALPLLLRGSSPLSLLLLRHLLLMLAIEFLLALPLLLSGGLPLSFLLLSIRPALLIRIRRRRFVFLRALRLLLVPVPPRLAGRILVVLTMRRLRRSRWLLGTRARAHGHRQQRSQRGRQNRPVQCILAGFHRHLLKRFGRIE
jgi:hypothetical protein